MKSTVEGELKTYRIDRLYPKMFLRRLLNIQTAFSEFTSNVR